MSAAFAVCIVSGLVVVIAIMIKKRVPVSVSVPLLMVSAVIFVISGAIAGALVISELTDNEDERVREFVTTTHGVEVHGVNTSDRTVNLELVPGCVYTMNYLRGVDGQLYLEPGTEKFLEAGYEYYDDVGLAIKVNADDCPDDVYGVQGGDDEPSLPVEGDEEAQAEASTEE